MFITLNEGSITLEYDTNENLVCLKIEDQYSEDFTPTELYDVLWNILDTLQTLDLDNKEK